MTSGFSHILRSDVILARWCYFRAILLMETSSAWAKKAACGCRDVGEQTDGLTTCNGVLADDFTAALVGSHVKSIDGKKKKKKKAGLAHPSWN